MVVLTDDSLFGGFGNVSIHNQSRNWNFQTGAFKYEGPGTTVEFIVEPPSVDGLPVELADFGSVRFINCKINNIFVPFGFANFTEKDRGFMTDYNNIPIAVPSLPDVSPNGSTFTVAYQNNLIPPPPWPL